MHRQQVRCYDVMMVSYCMKITAQKAVYSLPILPRVNCTLVSMYNLEVEVSYAMRVQSLSRETLLSSCASFSLSLVFKIRSVRCVMTSQAI